MENLYQEEFCQLFREHVSREGGDRLLSWLATTDFFTAPASTKFHCACEFGLVLHLSLIHISFGKVSTRVGRRSPVSDSVQEQTAYPQPQSLISIS